MLDPITYKMLVPNAPTNRRTDKDFSPLPEFAVRATHERFMLERAIQPGLQQPSLISSYSGSLDRILFAFPKRFSSETQDEYNSRVAAYKSLISELREGTKFIVIVHESNKATIENWFTSARHPATNLTIVSFENYLNFTDWAEDAYVALIDSVDGAPYLMEPWEFPRAGDALIAEGAQDHTDITASQAPLIFQGGNCLIGSDFWLLGKDYFADSIDLTQRPRAPVSVPSGSTPEKFVRQLFRDYVDQARRLIVLGTRRQIPLASYYGVSEGGAFYLDIVAGGVGVFQPIFHIDMFVTLVGENGNGQFEVLVGSPSMADQLLGTTSSYSINSVYDETAAQLANEGFLVTRNPLVHRPTTGQSLTIEQLRDIANQRGDVDLLDAVRQLVASGATNTDSAIIRDWHHVTWNNCLVESSKDKGKHVYLPTFGHGDNSDLAVIDQEMKKIWEDQDRGFTVHSLGDFSEFAKRQGVVHCIKKYLMRGE